MAITREKQAQILALYAEGEPVRQIARVVKVDRKTVVRAINRIAESEEGAPESHGIKKAISGMDEKELKKLVKKYFKSTSPPSLPKSERAAMELALKTYEEQLAVIKQQLQSVAVRVMRAAEEKHGTNCRAWATAQGILIDKVKVLTEEIQKIRRAYGADKSVVISFKREVVDIEPATEAPN